MGFIKRLFSRRKEQDDINILEREAHRERILLLKQRVNRLRKMREVEKLRQEEEDLQDDLSGFDEEEEEQEPISQNPDDMLMGLITSILAKKGLPQSSVQETFTQNPTPLANENVNYSDEELRELKKKVPKMYLKIAKKADDNLIANQITKHLGNIDEETMKRAIKIIRE